MRSINENSPNTNALLKIENELFNISKEASTNASLTKVQNLWNYLLIKKNKNKNKNIDFNDFNDFEDLAPVNSNSNSNSNNNKNNEYKCLIKL